MILYAFDPGESTGWAKFVDTQIAEIGTTKLEDIYKLIEKLEGDIFVVESFTVDKKRTGQWDKGKTLQVIGALKLRANQIGAIVVEQQPSIKPIAYKWMGGQYQKGKKNQHHLDAVAHGNYYLIKNKLKLPG